VSLVRFGEWLPDLAVLENPGSTEAKNCLPVARDYTQFRALTGATTALSGRPYGAFTAFDTSSNVKLYAATQRRIYNWSGTAWTDVSKGGANYSALTEAWSFAQYNTTLIATNLQDPVQSMTVGGAAFANLAGTPPQSRYVGVIGNFVFLGNQTGAPNLVQWCAIDDPTTWTATSTNQAGSEYLPGDLGPVTSIHGWSEYGLVIQEHGITRFTYTGGPQVFQVETFEPARGSPYPFGAVKVGRRVYFVGQDGFYVTDGFQVEPIGQGKVDITFRGEVNDNYPLRVSCAVDPINKLIFWSFPSTSSGDGTPNRLYIYNYIEGRWTNADQTTGLLHGSYGLGYTLDGLDSISTNIDTGFAESLDSPVYRDGTPLLGGFTSDHKFGSFTGTAQTATIDSTEVNLNPGGRSHVKAVKPVCALASSASQQVYVGTRATQTDAIGWGDATQPNSRTGWANFRRDAVYHRARVVISGGFTKAIGIEFEFAPSGFN
jgi:hypothetical protein